MTDEDYMKLAIKEAKKGVGAVNPNPMVGAVIVKSDRIVSTGYHEAYGTLHAERNAILNCKEPLTGATIYVTLEPCCHYGKTPPCTEAIMESGISRVVIGSDDPNPLVAGKGIKQLQEHGITVTCGVLKEECDALNEVFFHYITTKLPYVVLKYAMTMDGKIATSSGDSKWVTSEAAREQVQKDRHQYMGILVGINTVRKDDPMLNARIANGRDPIRIICDTSLRTPLSANVVKTANKQKTIIATCCEDMNRRKLYEKAGCEVLCLPRFDGQVDLMELMRRLGEKKIDSILLEGGGTLNWSALQSGIVKKVKAYIAPKLLGGATAITPIMGEGAAKMSDAILLERPTITPFGEDWLLESKVRITCLPES